MGVTLADAPLHTFRPSLSWGTGAPYLLDGNDLASGLLDLLEATKEVPVPRLRDGDVRREDGHAVEGGRGLGLGGQVTPDHLVLLKTAWNLLAQGPADPRFFPSFPGPQEPLPPSNWCSVHSRSSRVSHGPRQEGRNWSMAPFERKLDTPRQRRPSSTLGKNRFREHGAQFADPS